jgi:hypothetical protein
MFYRYTQSWDPGSGKNLIHKLITLFAIFALVAFVVQFDAQEWSHRLRVAKQEVDMFTVNLVGVNPRCWHHWI